MATDKPTAEKPVDKPRRRSKLIVLLGFVMTFVGCFSYFLVAFQYPELRDFPIINLPLVVLGVIVAAYGCLSVFRQSGVLGKSAASLGMLLTLLLAGLFNYYIFVMSYQLPTSPAAPATDAMAPDFTLLDHQGEEVKLSDFQGKKVVLIFYRGNW